MTLLRRVRCVAGALILVAAAAGCERSDEDPRVVIRDSAGVRIVESAAPLLDSSTAWTVGTVPILEIGADEADSMQRLDRVEGALRLGDGRIVVTNGAPPALRWYDSTGRFLHGTGRYGQGPGEFDGGEGAIWISHTWPLAGDSVATWEHSRRRMQVFDAHGQYARGVVIDLPPNMHRLSYPAVTGRTTNGFAAYLLDQRVTDGPLGVVRRDSATHIRYTAAGRYVGEIARLPAFPRYVAEMRRPGMARTFRSSVAPLFAPGFTAIPHGDRLYHGSADKYEIAAYDSIGALTMLVRRAATRRPVTPETIEQYREWRYGIVGDNTDLRREVDAWLEQAKVADSLPFYRRFRFDRDGAMWVQEYVLSGEPSTRWSVFDPEGRWLTDLAMPTAWTLADIGRDYILAVERNDEDVERVRMYTLSRGSR